MFSRLYTFEVHGVPIYDSLNMNSLSFFENTPRVVPNTFRNTELRQTAVRTLLSFIENILERIADVVLVMFARAQ